MPIKLANNATTTTVNALTTTTTEVVVATGTGLKFPVLSTGDYFYATLSDVFGNYEIVRVTARVVDTLTVIRAQESTTARAFPANSRIELRITAQSVLDALSTSINYLGASATNPTTRPDGTPVVVGDFYFNTVDTQILIYNGSEWIGVGVGSVTTDEFSGNGATVAYTLSISPSNKVNTQVYVNGVYQEKDSYTVSGATLTFLVAPPVGSSIEVITIENIGVPSAALVGYQPAGSGAVTTTVQSKLRETVSVKDFGAVGDGVADDANAIRAGIDYLLSIGGGTLFFPDGTYTVGKATSNLLSSAIEFRNGENNITLKGQSRDNTIIKLKNGENLQLILIVTSNVSGSCDYITIRDMTLDGNEANNPTGGCCIRSNGSLNHVVFQNLIIKNSHEYGIGLQYGTLNDVRFLDLYIHDTIQDGIDTKNRNNNNIGLIYNNIVCYNFGKGGGAGSLTGLDIRGHAVVSNVFCYGYGLSSGKVGVRWQGNDPNNGNGGMYCKGTNIICMPDTNVGTQGLVIYGEGSSFESCSVIGAGIGFYTISDNGTFENCIAKSCTVGFLAQPANPLAMKTYIRGCQAVDCGTGMRLRGGSHYVSHSVCLRTTVVGFLAEFDSTDVNLYFCETYPASGNGFTAGGSGFVSFGSKTINNTRYDFGAAFSAGRSNTQYVALTGDGAGNYITGVSVVGIPKNLVVSADANSAGLVLRTEADANVSIIRNNVTKISATANSVSLTLPSSSVGLSPGELYKDGGFVKIA